MALKAVEVEGRRELKDMLKNVAPNVARNVTRAAVDALAKEVAGLMEGRVKKRTERLAKSIKTKRRNPRFDDFRSEVRMGHDAPYGWMLEFGTIHTDAQPFIAPSVEEVRAKLTQRYRELVGEKLEKSLRRAKK